MTHSPTATNQVYTCAACSFRAVQTTRGLFVLDPGDDKQHLDAITAQQAAAREWVTAVVTRIRARCSGDERWTMRLIRCVMMEYGE